ncbi:MAG: hypothetical protein JNK45_07435, partial [Myxococcales bacterium]|nr:hypothetical protein [Myxococcales bacterium]
MREAVGRESRLLGGTVRNLLLPPIVTLVSIAAMFALDRLWPGTRLW